MEQRYKKHHKNSKKPSWFSMLVALLIAISLPYILVTTFSPPQKTKLANQSISLPKPLIQPDEYEEPSSVNNNEWNIIKTRKGDSLATIFNQLGISAKTLQAVLLNNPHKSTLNSLKPGQELQFLINQNRLEKLIVPLTTTQYIVIYRDNDRYKTKINTKKISSHNHYATAVVKGSLYSTAKHFNIPYKLVRQMSEIFNWQIDFSKDVRAGDQFTIIYEAYYSEGMLVGTGNIIAVTYTNRGHKYQAIRHKNNKGNYEYYNEQGKSLKKAFNRYPIEFSYISSGFSYSRNHPILNGRRAHKGVDLAAPLGTPIRATGDGTIKLIGHNNGYGKVIKIQHRNNFTTVYAHMLRFQKGLAKGSKVKRGQVIGYVGQSGLATGPHCHYEFQVNKKPKNPSTIHLPQSKSLTGQELASFKTQANTLLAHLKLFEEAYIASKENNSANFFG